MINRIVVFNRPLVFGLDQRLELRYRPAQVRVKPFGLQLVRQLFCGFQPGYFFSVLSFFIFMRIVAFFIYANILFKSTEYLKI